MGPKTSAIALREQSQKLKQINRRYIRMDTKTRKIAINQKMENRIGFLEFRVVIVATIPKP